MTKLTMFKITLIIMLIATQHSAFAVSPTPTLKPSPTVSRESEELKKIEKIKELVASKVAELKLVEKRGILGKVSDVSNTQITALDHKKNLRIIDIDELTRFQAPEKSSAFGISDIKVGEQLSFIGLYNKETEKLLARFVTRISSIPIYFEGEVSRKDSDDFALGAVDRDGTEKTIDIEKSTKTQSYTKSDGLLKSGFSKIEVGERILVIGFPSLSQKDRISASRIIYFKDIPF